MGFSSRNQWLRPVDGYSEPVSCNIPSIVVCKCWNLYLCGQSSTTTSVVAFQRSSRPSRKIYSAPRLLYSNSTVTFCILLSGDVESNPGPGNTQTSSVKVYYQNVRSLKNKMDVYNSDLNAHLIQSNLDIVALTETWLNCNVLDSELSVSNYTLFRRDRDTDKRGGGILMLVNNKFTCNRVERLESDSTEFMWIEIQLKRRISLLVGLFYRPPNATPDVLRRFTSSVEIAMLYYKNSEFLILGDFNLPEINWSSNPYSAPAQSMGEHLLDVLLSSCGLFQCNTYCTRMDKMLDLVICSKNISDKVYTANDIFLSDHSSLRIDFRLNFDVNCSNDNLNRKSIIYNFKALDVNNLCNTLNCVPWSVLIDFEGDLNEALDMFYNLLNAAVNDTVPKIRKRRKLPPWFDNELRSALQLKENEPSPDVPRDYPGLPDYAVDNLSSLSVNQHSVEKALSNIDINKATGIDQISNVVLKGASSSLSYPLCKLFQLSINSGVFPSSWKHANIVPIHKSGPKKLICNYRPISLLPTMSKIFERIVHDGLSSHVANALSPRQHGFVSGRSCQTNLALLLATSYDAINSKKQCDVIYTDFSKAFDSVSHDLLIFKLSKFGLSGSLLRCFFTSGGSGWSRGMDGEVGDKT
ncbi:uncharacterized protein [Antedon mediterranea]|uniref:uncharacterized protein n=1 Tax=Antedon mediterranea TaxID=105859 RepID=UPI003AF9425C